jgi:hypothetical protein
MNIKNIIKTCPFYVSNLTAEELFILKKLTNKQPIKMEKSTPKPRVKKATKIDVAIARVQDAIDTIDLQINDLVSLNSFYEGQLADLKRIKNDKDLI